MQIQLKQGEIVAALKMFIVSQGISLTNKAVDISFISGRKDNGITAEITIEDAGAPQDSTIKVGDNQPKETTVSITAEAPPSAPVVTDPPVKTSLFSSP